MAMSIAGKSLKRIAQFTSMTCRKTSALLLTQRQLSALHVNGNFLLDRASDKGPRIDKNSDILLRNWRHQLGSSKKYVTTTICTSGKNKVKISFIDRDEDKITVEAMVGDTLLDVAKDNDIDLEGACEGTLACSTCHLIFDPEQFETLSLDPPSEEELDMLDLAFGLTDTSRLGCQIVVTEDMDGLVLKVPSGTSDARLK